MSRRELIQSRNSKNKQLASLKQMNEDFKVQMFIQKEVARMLSLHLPPKMLTPKEAKLQGPKELPFDYVTYDKSIAKFIGTNIKRVILGKYSSEVSKLQTDISVFRRMTHANHVMPQ